MKKLIINADDFAKTENRNIFTGITKVGKSFKPDDYFQFNFSSRRPGYVPLRNETYGQQP